MDSVTLLPYLSTESTAMESELSKLASRGPPTSVCRLSGSTGDTAVHAPVTRPVHEVASSMPGSFGAGVKTWGVMTKG